MGMQTFATPSSTKARVEGRDKAVKISPVLDLWIKFIAKTGGWQFAERATFCFLSQTTKKRVSEGV